MMGPANAIPGALTYVLSLGSNLGDRLGNLQGAVDRLGGLENLTITDVSGVYRTSPVGVIDQPEFLNIVLRAESRLEPLALLHTVLGIEAAFGRVRVQPGGPRSLDIDLITAGELVVDRPGLMIPHPRAHERAFVLVPWLEIDPDAALPGWGRVDELLAALPQTGVSLATERQVNW